MGRGRGKGEGGLLLYSEGLSFSAAHCLLGTEGTWADLMTNGSRDSLRGMLVQSSSPESTPPLLVE